MDDDACTDDEYCPERKDGTHCACWWDGDGCCACGADPMSVDQKLAQGMDVDDDSQGIA